MIWMGFRVIFDLLKRTSGTSQWDLNRDSELLRNLCTMQW